MPATGPDTTSGHGPARSPSPGDCRLCPRTAWPTCRPPRRSPPGPPPREPPIRAGPLATAHTDCGAQGGHLHRRRQDAVQLAEPHRIRAGPVEQEASAPAGGVRRPWRVAAPVPSLSARQAGNKKGRHTDTPSRLRRPEPTGLSLPAFSPEALLVLNQHLRRRQPGGKQGRWGASVPCAPG